MSSSAKYQLYIVSLIVLLGFIGNSIAYPIFAPLFLHPKYGNIVPHQLGSTWRNIFLGITLTMYPLGQFIGLPILGALSDRHGRKKILLISIWSQVVFYLLTALSLIYNLLWLLILSRLLTGCTEGNLSIARSIVVDNTELNRHKNLGLISAMAAFGYILGPLIGGIFTDRSFVVWFNFSVPFAVAALLSLVIVIIVTLYLHESIAKPYDSGIILFQQFNISKTFNFLCHNKKLKVLLIASSITYISYDAYYEFYPAYLTGLRHATSLQIAWYTAILSTAIGISCGWLSHTLAYYFKNRQLIIFSLLVLFLCLIALLLLSSPWMMIVLFISLGLAIGFSSTNYTLQVSEVADIHIQGEIFGTILGLRMLLDSFVSFIGGLLLVIAYTLPIGVAALAALIGWIIYYKTYKL